MTKYTYIITATEKVSDHTCHIRPGHELYGPNTTDEIELFDTADDAVDAGWHCHSGLDGGLAYNEALKTADVSATEVQFSDPR